MPSERHDSDQAGQADDQHDECWDGALFSYGTSYIFERRARSLRRKLQIVTFSSMAVPVVVGGLALGYGAGFKALPVVIAIGSGVGVAQLALSLWSIVANWVDAYAYANESTIANKNIFAEYSRLAKTPRENAGDFAIRLGAVQEADKARQDQDYKYVITDEEKRMGMRAGLRQLRRECDVCHEVPKSMAPGNCDVCGNF